MKGIKTQSSEDQAAAAVSLRDDVAAEARATGAGELNLQPLEAGRFLATELSDHYLLQSLSELHSSPSIKNCKHVGYHIHS